MSFSGQSNPPWQRNNLNNVLQGQIVGGNAAVGQLSYHQSNSAQMFLQQPQQNLGYGAMQSSGGMYQQSGGGGASVSYPQARTGLNPVAFQNSSGGAQLQGQSQHRSQQQNYNSIGTVTKISSDCGLVNEEVFFYRNVCKGHIPKLGDRVLFEASFSPNGQFKWNATRIQLMPQPGMNSNQPPPLMGASSGEKNGSGYNAVPPPNEYQRQREQQRRAAAAAAASPRRGSPGRDRHQRSERDRHERERNPRQREADDDENDRKRRREDPDRSKDRSRTAVSRSDRDRERDRDRDDAKRLEDKIIQERRKALSERERERERERARALEKDRERSPAHRVGAGKARRTRTIRRYMVQIPKTVLTIKYADIQELRQRYSTLYIPSDFFHADIKWTSSFTHENPFSLCRPCQFLIKNKDVEPITGAEYQTAEFTDPADADYLYSAKVMLLSCPPIAELYQKCFETDEDVDNDHHALHPSRLISFLVGTRGRNEPMAIGGPWSPSLDGENPDKDPSVLIRTAIRTCRALTGIDLSNCTQWYRFVELYYHRTDHKNKEQDVPPRIETVVIYLPDIHSCVPTVAEWEQLAQAYKDALDNVIRRRTDIQKPSASTEAESEAAGTSTLANDSNTTEEANDPDDAVAENLDGAQADEKNNQPIEVDTSTGEDAVEEIIEVMDDAAAGDSKAIEKDDDTPEPTHYSELDLKTMKVQEIRNELSARNLPAKGVRNLLMARLAKALNAEKAEEEAASAASEVNNAVEEIEEIMDCDSEEENNVGESNADENVEEDADESKQNEPEPEEEQEEEEQEDWTNVDMNDIVILDEYDSSKNPEDGPKELDEQTKKQLTRRYLLPENISPQIIVHPSTIAKGGKFKCTTMSLSVLLDYRPEDTKERFFEVSLFAELFNEMLMRDFGFNIYKELYLQKETTPIETVDITDDASTNKKEEKSNEDDQKSVKDNNGAVSNESSSNGTKAKERRVSKQSIDVEPTEEDSQSIKSSADRKRKTTEKSAVDKKMVVVKPHLLLSFVYFDTTHCGYIFENDLEDLFSILGLNLSRGQIRKVLGKSATRHAFYYRKLTDKEESVDAPPSIEEPDNISSEELRKIALGNKQYYPIFNNENGEIANSSNTTITDDNNGLINFKGAVIHVGKLVEQIKRTERSFSDLDKLYNDLRKQYGDLQKEHSKSNGKIKDLQSEVRSLNRRISDTDQDLYAVNRKYKDQQATLSYIYNRVAPYFNREKDHKSESGRDKDSDKHKDKESEKSSKDNDKTAKDNKEKDNEKALKDKEKEGKDIKEKSLNKEEDKDAKNSNKEKISVDKEQVTTESNDNAKEKKQNKSETKKDA